MKDYRNTLKGKDVTVVRNETQPDSQKQNLRGWTINLPEKKKGENPNLLATPHIF